MARPLKPGDRVARPQLDRTIHGEVITYNGELRVLREDTQEADLPVGWYLLDPEKGCGDATCPKCTGAPDQAGRDATADLEPGSYVVVVGLRGFPESTDELARRVRRTLETHPTLSLRVDEVVAGVAPSSTRDAVGLPELALLKADAQRWANVRGEMMQVCMERLGDPTVQGVTMTDDDTEVLVKAAIRSEAKPGDYADGHLAGDQDRFVRCREDIARALNQPTGPALAPWGDLVENVREAVKRGVHIDVKQLDVKPDSVLVVSMPKGSPVQMLDQFSVFQKALKARLGDGVLVIGVEQGTSIDTLADRLLLLGRAVLCQTEVLRLQAQDTRVALLEEALRPWLESRAAGPLPRTTQGWMDRLTDEMNASATLEREVRQFVGPIVSHNDADPHAAFVTYKGERRVGDWSKSGDHARHNWPAAQIAIYAWKHGRPVSDPAPSVLSPAQLREMQAFPALTEPLPRAERRDPPRPAGPRWFVLRKPDTTPEDYYWFENADGGTPILGQIATCDGMTIAEKERNGWTKVGMHPGKDGKMYGPQDTYRLSVVGYEPQRGLKHADRMYMVLDDGTLDPEHLEGQGIDYDVIGPWES